MSAVLYILFAIKSKAVRVARTQNVGTLVFGYWISNTELHIINKQKEVPNRR